MNALTLQMDRDKLKVDVFCFGSWRSGDCASGSSWLDAGEAAALAAICLHWTDVISFARGSRIKRSLLQFAMRCGQSAHLAPTHTLMLAAQRGLYHGYKTESDLRSPLQAGAELHAAESAAGYPEVWPPSGVLLLWLACAAESVQDHSEALRLSSAARRILGVTHHGTEVLTHLDGTLQRCARNLSMRRAT